MEHQTVPDTIQGMLRSLFCRFNRISCITHKNIAFFVCIVLVFQLFGGFLAGAIILTRSPCSRALFLSFIILFQIIHQYLLFRKSVMP